MSYVKIQSGNSEFGFAEKGIAVLHCGSNKYDNQAMIELQGFNHFGLYPRWFEARLSMGPFTEVDLHALKLAIEKYFRDHKIEEPTLA